MFQMFVTTTTSTDDHTNNNQEEPLIVRVALSNECTTGKSDVVEHCKKDRQMKDVKGYADLLRENVGFYPKRPVLGVEPLIFSEEEDSSSSSSADQEKFRLTFDWDVQTFPSLLDAVASTDDSEKELLMFALPHHQAILEPIEGISTNQVLTDYCKPTFHGSTCLVKGSKWSLEDKLGQPQAWIGERPPESSAIPDLADSLVHDIKFRLSDNLKRAAADTYFSGKILARLGRVILIATEMKHLAAAQDDTINNDSLPSLGAYDKNMDPERYSLSVKAAKKATMPTDDEIAEALTELREGVEVWINGTGEAQYIYDSTWGGLVNCGCTFIIEDTEHPDKGYCNNTFPDCPVLTDVNVDFGNGFYNDHHFHYGYHVYAAAVVAKFDPAWGRTFFDRVMLYIRDYANPSADDPYFPQFRQKDWFLGSSWASGFISANTPHGRNQESSSESIAAYEGMALFGDAMMDAFRADSKTKRREKDAKQVRDAGRLLTAMEVKATQRYYHVWNSTKHVNTYPPQYKQPVVAMLYETMASFQTWFAGGDMVSIGIQLLPFTPVSERRDNPEWASLAYKPFEKSCYSDKDFCIKNGWSILLCGLKATIGDREEARKDALTIPEKVFLSDGGDGHSRSNLIWYVATRPDVNLTQSTEEDTSTTVN